MYVFLLGLCPAHLDALPLLMAMARRLEEGEFQRGAGRLTEVWDGQSTIPYLTPHATSRPKRPKKVLEEELDEIVTGVAAAATHMEPK